MNTLYRPKNILFSLIAIAIVLVPAYSNAATDTITGLLGKTEDLSTLKTLVELADLDGALDSTESQFTVFAPKNSGFAALPKEVTDALVKTENVAVLAGILKYHVIPSKILSTDLAETQTVTTLNGDTIVVAKNESGVTITDKTGGVSKVVTADVEATNGVVHI
ncbi:MAG: fasciclin domain-containing protein, partial [Candidatus Paceibacterota bacterium]